MRGRNSNRSAIGARIHVEAAGGEQWKRVTSTVGYASSSELSVDFGLGAEAGAVHLTITWPGGGTQSLKDVAVDRTLDVEEAEPDQPR